MSTATIEPRPGSRTTELWGKVVVQAVLLANALFNLGIEIDDQMALALVGLMETAYAISRGIAKRPVALPPEAKTEDRARRLEELLVALTVALAERPPSNGDRTPKTP